MADLRVSFPRPCDERWEAMAPAGCGRLCARCDQIIHDLSRYDADEAEALLRAQPGTCVRAAVGPDGGVATRPGRGGRRLVVAAALTAGLLSGAPALAAQDRPAGAISGRYQIKGERVRVVATDQAGRKYQTHTGDHGRYRIAGLPPGTYKLSFDAMCGEPKTLADIVVGRGETVVPATQVDYVCIVVGRLRIEDGPRGDPPPAEPAPAP
jgi:hypothetical protein